MRSIFTFLLVMIIFYGNLTAQEKHPLLGNSFIVEDLELLTVSPTNQNQISSTIYNDNDSLYLTVLNSSAYDLPAIVAVAAGYDHSVALKPDEYIFDWGRDDNGQVGNTPTGNDFIQIAAGTLHNLAIKSDNSIVAWGSNSWEQCNVPADSDFIQVSGGYDHSLALKSDGSIVTWGRNDHNQVSDVPAGNDFTQIAAGGFHNLALKSDGSVVAWGYNANGQANVPAGNDFTQIAAGEFHNLAIKSDSSIVAWGSNSWEQCNVPADSDFIQVSGGYDHSLALKSDGSIVTWGRNDLNQVSDVPAGNDFTQIAAGGFHNLALKSDGSVVAWGSDTWDQCKVVTFTQPLDVVTGDFNGDNKDDYIYGLIKFGKIDLELGTGSGSAPYSFATGHSVKSEFAWSSLFSSKTDFHLAAGNFDMDEKKEIVLAHKTPDDQLTISLYEANQTLDDLNPLASANNIHHLQTPLFYGNNFDIATGDFDGDGTDELLIVTFATRGEIDSLQSIWCEDNNLRADLFAIVYDYDHESQTFTRQKEQLLELTFEPFGTYEPWYYNLAVVCGDLNNDSNDEFAVAFDVYLPNYACFSVCMPFTINDSPWEITGKTTYGWSTAETEFYRIWHNYNPGQSKYLPLSIDCIDLNADGADEIMVAYASVWKVFYTNLTSPTSDPLTFIQTEIIEIPEYQFEDNLNNCMIAVGDVFEGADQAPGKADTEILVAYRHSGRDKWVVAVWRMSWVGPAEDYYSLDEVGLTELPEKTNFAAIALGDFDGDAVRANLVNHIEKEIHQPIIILNAPPFHFDVLDSDTFNVSMFDNSYASYRESSDTTSQSSFNVQSDWGLTSSLRAGGSFFGIGLETSITASAEQSIANFCQQNQTKRVSETDYTYEDALICATVTDYDFYEYALYQSGQSIGNMLIVDSKLQDPPLVWKTDKLMNDMYYIQNHEVGNIFSYSSIADAENQINCERMLHKFSSASVGGTTTRELTISLSEAELTEDEKLNKIGLEVSSSVSGWGVDLSVSGSYSREEISTHSSEFNNEVEIELIIDKIDDTIGSVEYQVMPFIYWAKSGALVVDYAVDPITDPGDPTWWQNRYGDKPDPAFILPWRLHEAKGKTLDPPVKKFKTRSIRISPSVAQAGDTVQIHTRVHNFSLLEITESVTVRFYVGDPDNGGVPIVGHGNVEELIITDGISAQSSREDSMTWTVPPDLDIKTGIYGVIDQDNAIDEVHENNNKGYIYLYDISVGVEDELDELVPDDYALKQNYPNPFNPSTTISYQIPKPCQVEIKIYDILGRHVNTLVNERQNAGQYQYQWDGESSMGNRVSSGIYLYRLKAGDYTMVKKMVLLK